MEQNFVTEDEIRVLIETYWNVNLDAPLIAHRP